ncbi:MAG: response regulator [Thermodesulfobacteriota bacterium]
MKRILVVEDHKEIRNLLSKFFLLNGYEVDSVEDGDMAIRYVKENRYDLIVTDYMMPNMNGIDLLKRIKMDNPQLSILVISGSGVGEPFFREAGADAFLTKPLDLSSMKILVEKILNSK